MLKMFPGGGICLFLLLQFFVPPREAAAGFFAQAESHHLDEAPPSSFSVHRNEESPQSSGDISDEGQRRLKRRLKSSKLPEFGAPIGNVTSVLGRDVRLICTVENLGQYQVAWLKEESKTILSIDTNIIITNYRIFLIPDEEERKWVLHIKDVQESDRGFYQCQVNTSPTRSTSGYLEVVVPPTIAESQSTRVAEVVEHSDVSLQCKADGHPRPTITWRRDDGSPIRLNGLPGASSGGVVVGDGGGGGSIGGDDEQANQTLQPASIATVQSMSFSSLAESQTPPLPPPPPLPPSLQTSSALSQLTDVKSDKLSLKSVDRFMAGIYVCTASNGIPSQVSKRIPLYVKFPPKTSISHEYISVSLGDELEIDCIIEAFPKANSYWSKKALSLSSLQQNDRGYWADGSRWLQISGASRAPSYRAKQILQPTDGTSAFVDQEIGNSNRTSPATSQIRLEVAKRATSSSDDSLIREQGAPDMSAAGRRHLISSLGGNFRWSSGGSTQAPVAAIGAEQTPASTSSKAYVTVRQTPLNTFTYKLRLSIAQMQPDDYGEYICISTNSMGSSKSKVTVTKTDKSEVTDRSDYRSVGEDDYEHDSAAADQARPSAHSNQAQQQQSSSVRRGSGNRVVYDGNYLQAIKTRQNNLLGPNRLQPQQNLKLRQFSDKNSASSDRGLVARMPVIVSLMTLMALLPLRSPCHQTGTHRR